MPMLLRAIVYFAITAVMIAILGTIPSSEKEFRTLGALVVMVWCLGGLFYGLRGVFRFMTR